MPSPYDLLMPIYKVESIEDLIKKGFSRDEAYLIQWRDQKVYQASIAQSVIEMRGQLETLHTRLESAEKEADWLAQFAVGGECPPEIERGMAGGAVLRCDKDCIGCWRKAARIAIARREEQCQSQ